MKAVFVGLLAALTTIFSNGGLPSPIRGPPYRACLPSCNGLHAGDNCGANCTCHPHHRFNYLLACVKDGAKIPHGIVRVNRRG
uniref:Mucin n=1 Tax=Rhipicephalus zambeziensis TaxID=60191 RepID=A0A224YD46_9ACAR